MEAVNKLSEDSNSVNPFEPVHSPQSTFAVGWAELWYVAESAGVSDVVRGALGIDRISDVEPLKEAALAALLARGLAWTDGKNVESRAEIALLELALRGVESCCIISSFRGEDAFDQCVVIDATSIRVVLQQRLFGVWYFGFSELGSDSFYGLIARLAESITGAMSGDKLEIALPGSDSAATLALVQGRSGAWVSTDAAACDAGAELATAVDHWLRSNAGEVR